MQVDIKLTADQSARMLAMQDCVPRLLQPLAQAWSAGALMILGRAVRGRFTGQGPFPVSENRLGVKTNRLRSSLRATAPQINPSIGELSVGMGSNVSYFAAHEFGFRGKVQVQAFDRRAPGQVVKRGRGKKKAEPPRMVHVRGHSRSANIPARAPLGTELAADTSRTTMTQQITAAIKKNL